MLLASLIGDIQMQAFEAQKKTPNSSIASRGAQSNIPNLTPGEWWHACGVDYKDLQIMARKILHQ